MEKLNISIGVGGRFHADKMARGLLGKGHQVTVVTSLPRFRFADLPQNRVRCFPVAEFIYRGASLLGMENKGDHFKMKKFGRFFANSIEQNPPDVAIAWSSFALEAFEQKKSGKQILIRDSAHIESQYELLKQEHDKWGQNFAPREFCKTRELKEYELADKIIVLSNYAKKSFVERGVDESKIEIVRLGVDTEQFHPLEDKKLNSPTRVLFLGTVGLRKGVVYLLEATKGFKDLKVYLAGPVEKGFHKILARYPHAHVLGAQPFNHVACLCREMDIFVMPSLDDGFGQTLIQAMASGLVPITTDHCGASDLIEDGDNGYILSPRDVTGIQTALTELKTNPDLYFNMRAKAIASAKVYHWEQYTGAVNQCVGKAVGHA